LASKTNPFGTNYYSFADIGGSRYGNWVNFNNSTQFFFPKTSVTGATVPV
jgi:hypothetical protein